ncbi:hypothetical protein Bbelb_204100 [Branchiostoma belcheri]|nr:hypothetical protein Bbelb_204100 [Branchiostoma belcheri]
MGAYRPGMTRSPPDRSEEMETVWAQKHRQKHYTADTHNCSTRKFLGAKSGFSQAASIGKIPKPCYQNRVEDSDKTVTGLQLPDPLLDQSRQQCQASTPAEGDGFKRTVWQ